MFISFSKDKLLRIGGSLENSYMSFNSMHSIVLPCKSTLTDMIISHYHVRCFSYVLQNCFIISRKNIASYMAEIVVEKSRIIVFVVLRPILNYDPKNGRFRQRKEQIQILYLIA